MAEIAVRAVGLGKRYRIGQRQRYKALRDSVAEAVAAPVRRLRRLVGTSRPEGDVENTTIWALRDVSFEINAGMVVGIIGRNGVGKSTLLKVLSRITEPTTGYAEINGRVGSLLEVGTGFHPELTGRENVYLNGAVLGMKRREIDLKFDQIVEFAEIERFLDTAVKFYSSGMYVRLAFAVAAHLEPEILLVDEVLAVGDAAFQRKCLGKMGEIAQSGRTVLFVSHQMNAIRRLCDRAMWLEAGQLRLAGDIAEIVTAYEMSLASPPKVGQTRSHTGARFLDWEILEPRGEPTNVLMTMGPVAIKMRLEVTRFIRHGAHGIALWSRDGQLVWAWATYDLTLEPGIHSLLYSLPGLPLRPGAYSWQVSVRGEHGLLDEWHGVPSLIVDTPPLGHPRDEWAGILNIGCEFHVLVEQRP